MENNNIKQYMGQSYIDPDESIAVTSLDNKMDNNMKQHTSQLYIDHDESIAVTSLNTIINDVKSELNEIQTDLEKKINYSYEKTADDINNILAAIAGLTNVSKNIISTMNLITNPKCEIIIKYWDCDTIRLEKIDKGDYVDLRAVKSYKIKKDTNCLVNLGVAMQLPEGYEAQVLPRSSLFKNYGVILCNSMGIIDNSYKGENDWWMANLYCIKPNMKNDDILLDSDDPKWFIKLYKSNFGKKILKKFFKKRWESHTYTQINKGDRICQFRITKNMPKVTFNETEFNNNIESRGGFGTTGTK